MHQSEVNALLQSKRCLLWPECACHQNLVHWQQALEDESRVFELDALAWAEEIIFYSCACVAEHCPDRKTRAYGARQVAELRRRRARIATASQIMARAAQQ